MRNYSTPTVSFADRTEYRRNGWTAPRIEMMYKSKQHSAYSGGRGFIVSASCASLMSLWLRGKL